MDGLQNESKREKAIWIKSPKPTKTPNAKVKWNRKSNKSNEFSFNERAFHRLPQVLHYSEKSGELFPQSRNSLMFWAHNHIGRCSNEQICAVCFSKLLSRFYFGDEQKETFMSLNNFHLRSMYFACYNIGIFQWLVFLFSSNGANANSMHRCCAHYHIYIIVIIIIVYGKNWHECA